MQTEPPNAGPRKRKRRWFQFSLRTLMIAVTLLAVPCAYVGWQAKIVRERKALLTRGLGPDVTPPGWWRSSESPPSLPLIRRWLGDQPICSMILPGSLEPSLIEELREAFPEATITVRPALHSPPLNLLTVGGRF